MQFFQKFWYKQYFWISKTVKFGCVPFDSNFKLLKDFLNTVFVLFEDHYWAIFQHDPTIFGEVRAKVGKKGPTSWIVDQYRKLNKLNFNFTTTDSILMKPTTDIYPKSVFHLATSAAIKMSLKIRFWVQF